MENSNNGIYYFIMLIVFIGLFFGVGYLSGPEDESIFDLETSGDSDTYLDDTTPEIIDSEPTKETNEPVEKEQLDDSSLAPDSSSQDSTMLDSAQASLRSDLVVRYYRKPLDGEKVFSLQEIGYYIHERPTKDYLRKYTSNAIYYGDSVRREDIINIARHLKENGVKLRIIEHSKYGDNWKSHSIEIGTDTTVVEMPEMTIEEMIKVVNENPYIKD